MNADEEAALKEYGCELWLALKELRDMWEKSGITCCYADELLSEYPQHDIESYHGELIARSKDDSGRRH